MRAHLKFHGFTLANIALLALVNFGLPALFGLDQFGEYSVSVAFSFLISGLITAFFDLSSSQTNLNYSTEILRRSAVGLTLYLIFAPKFGWSSFALTLVLTIAPINVLIMLRHKSNQFWLLYVCNLCITLLWISRWYITGEYVFNHLLIKEFLYYIVLVFLTRKHLHLGFVKLDKVEIKWNVLVLAFIDQTKLWIPLLLYVGSSSDLGLFRIELTLSYMMVTVLPLNPVSVLATGVDRRQYTKLVKTVIISVGIIYLLLSLIDNDLYILMNYIGIPTVSVRYIITVSYLYMIFRALSIWFLDMPFFLLISSLVIAGICFSLFLGDLKIAIIMFFSSFLFIIGVNYVWNRWLFSRV